MLDILWPLGNFLSYVSAGNEPPESCVTRLAVVATKESKMRHKMLKR